MIKTIVAPTLYACAILLIAGCTRLDHVERRTFAPDSFAAASAPGPDAGSIKVHMPDGSLYIFSSWHVSDEERRISGVATHLSAARDTLAFGTMLVPIDSIALVETNVRTSSGARIYFGALGFASAALTVYCITTPKACFGSCPTIYSATPDGPVLEAESFSHSIAPLFEMRDVDRIGAQPGPGGTLRLEIRNEALETHYINHLELLEVAHAPGAYAVPDGRGGAFVLDDFATVVSMSDRAGNDLAQPLSARDGIAFETDQATLAAAGSDDAFDYVDLALAAPASDSAAVLLSFRTSLLSTVLFYDYMLAGQGVGAIGWLSRTLDTISGAVEIGEFYTRWMGMRVAVHDGVEYRDVARFGGAGPIAWDDAAVAVPVLESDSLRVRISFLADAFRIDRIAVALAVERRTARVIPLDRVESSLSSLADRRPGNAPLNDHSSSDTPLDDQPSEDTPLDDQPSEDTPLDDQPSEDTPLDNQPSGYAPLDNQPSGYAPLDNQPSGYAPLDDQPSGYSTRDDQFLADAANPDERYLTTYPGTRFDAVFETGDDFPGDDAVVEFGAYTAGNERPGSNASGEARTYFLASQGYYIEWIRREWLQRETAGMPALASDEMLHDAFERWRAVKSDYEDLFFRTKIPVR